MKYSILIPVYNVEKYITRCLQSVADQKVTDYEVIMVNDGSTDGSAEVCAEYCEKDSRFFLIRQENMGLLRARRTALKHASGDYILFLDSDDFWNTNTLEKIDSMIVQNSPDVLVFRYQKFFSETHIEPGPVFFEDGSVFEIHNKRDYVLQWIKNPDLNAMWVKAVKRSCIDIENEYENFTGLSSGEDYIQSICIINRAKKIIYSQEVLYNYRVNENSISYTYNPEKLHHIHLGKNLFEDFLIKNYPQDKELAREFYKAYLTTLGGNLLFFYMNADVTTVKTWITYVSQQELFVRATMKSDLKGLPVFCACSVLAAKSQSPFVCKVFGWCLRLKQRAIRGRKL